MTQGVYWLLTIPHADYLPFLATNQAYIRGQLELGEGGFLHWQILVCYKKRCRPMAVKRDFGPTVHCELARSDAAREYVWKDETRIAGTQFELGQLPLRRGNSDDWSGILESAKAGRYDEIPPDILIRSYHAFKTITKDNLKPTACERTIKVFWGTTGTGKSRRAWDEGGLDAYPKDPCTKFWDGYQGQEHVIIDEFRGSIGISHMLRWCDRYPVIVEAKHGACTFKAKCIWITSNLEPRRWYPDADQETLDALLRRLEITQFHPPLM